MRVFATNVRGWLAGLAALGFCLLAAADSHAQGSPTSSRQDTNSLGMKFVKLPKGTFYMGWDGRSRATKKEIKQDFEIAIHTVTQGQWVSLMGSNPSFFSHTSRHANGKAKVKDIKVDDLKDFPVEEVSWHDAQAFIKKLNEKERGNGWLYRLPREAEWEYACRGGAASEQECSYHFYFAKPTNDLSSDQANFDGNYPVGQASKGPHLQRTTKVGSYPPNNLGLHDMHGNVWQWCQDNGGDGPPSSRAFRGGCWGSRSESRCQATDRFAEAPTHRSLALGFRVVRVRSSGK